MSRKKRKGERGPSRGAERRAQPAARTGGSRRGLVLVAVAVLAVAGFLAIRLVLPALRAPEIPDPITEEMQAPVVRALTQARQGVIDDPSSAAAWGKLGAACDAHKLYDDAITCYRRAAELDPNDFAWRYLLAVAQDFRGGDPDEVVRLFQEALLLNRSYPPALLRFGDALVRQGKNNEASEAYRRALELDPDFAMAHRGLGQVLLALGDPDQAVEHLQRALQLQPEDSLVFNALARGYRLIGDDVRAEQAVQQAARLEPSHAVPDPIRFDVEALAVSPVACIRRFQAAMAGRAYIQAIPDLELLVEMFPEAAVYHRDLGTCYQETGQRELALTHLQRAVSLDESLLGARRRLAAELLTQGQLPEAIEQFRRAHEQDPSHPDILNKLGLALGMSGDLDAAIIQFQRAAELDPEDPEAHHNLGTALMRRGDWAAAADEFDRALEHNPTSADSHYNLGLVLEKLGRSAEAKAHYRKAVEVNPGHPASQRLAALGG